MHRVGINENIFIDIVLMLYQPTRSTYIFNTYIYIKTVFFVCAQYISGLETFCQNLLTGT